ncbi:MAG: DUF1559 domain-containing protein [Planctomycetota bacterium]
MRCKRFGLTIVDWCVVLVCCFILLSLLAPRVGSRPVANRNMCSTNLKNLSLAAVQYDNTNGGMPGYVMNYGTWIAGENPRDPTDPSADTGSLMTHHKIGTWAVALLPWLDAQPTYEHWTHDRYPIVFGGSPSMPLSSDEAGDGFTTLAAPNLSILQCPDARTLSATHGRNSYIGNTGMFHRGPSGESNTRVMRAGNSANVDFARSMALANGVFNNKLPGRGRDGRSVAVGPNLSIDDFHDGQGFTLLFSENLQALPWHRAGFIDAVDLVTLDPLDVPLYEETSRYTQGMVWHYEDDKLPGAPSVDPVHRINGIRKGDDLFTLKMTRANAADLARPSSGHGAGVNAAFADGATRFISETIDYRVYQAMLTPDGTKSDVPNASFVITNELHE